MKKIFLIPLIVIPLLLFGYLLWKTLTLPVLYDKEIPPQQITGWEPVEIENFTLQKDNYYVLQFNGNAAIGKTEAGATIIVLLDEGEITIQQDHFIHTGKLFEGEDIEMSDEEVLFSDTYTFSTAFLRMHPDDPAFPTVVPIDNNELVDRAISIHTIKHARYLSEDENVRIPKKDVRIIDMDITASDLLIIDSDEHMSLYYVEGL